MMTGVPMMCSRGMQPVKRLSSELPRLSPITKKRLVNIGERNAHVVAEAAHDEVVADEQSIFHGLGGNNSSLADGGIDKKENQNDPSPCDDFAADFLLRREIFFGFALLRLFSFH